MSERLDELKALSKSLQEIGGVIRIVKASESSPRLYCIEDLQHTKECTLGEMFRAVREYYGKTPSDYGSKWVKYDAGNNNRYHIINNELKNKSDLEKLQSVCRELGEPEIPVLSHSETAKRLAEYKTKPQQ